MLVISYHILLETLMLSTCFYANQGKPSPSLDLNGCPNPAIGQWEEAYALCMVTTHETNTNYRCQLGVRIAQLRAEKGMSQRQFALVLELDRVTLNHIESGQGNPTLGTLERIADGLGISLPELLNA